MAELFTETRDERDERRRKLEEEIYPSRPRIGHTLTLNGYNTTRIGENTVKLCFHNFSSSTHRLGPLMEAIRQHPQLKILELSKCSFDEDSSNILKNLFQSQDCNIEKLHIGKIFSGISSVLPDIIVSSKPNLKEIRLDCEKNDIELHSLLDPLKTDAALESIHLLEIEWQDLVRFVAELRGLKKIVVGFSYGIWNGYKAILFAFRKNHCLLDATLLPRRGDFVHIQRPRFRFDKTLAELQASIDPYFKRNACIKGLFCSPDFLPRNCLNLILKSALHLHFNHEIIFKLLVRIWSIQTSPLNRKELENQDIVDSIMAVLKKRNFSEFNSERRAEIFRRVQQRI